MLTDPTEMTEFTQYVRNVTGAVMPRLSVLEKIGHLCNQQDVKSAMHSRDEQLINQVSRIPKLFAIAGLMDLLRDALKPETPVINAHRAGR